MASVLEFYSHVDGLSDADLDQLREWSQRGLPHCLAAPGPGSRDLPALDVIEISVVSDDVIAGVHEQFLDDPTPTDVITFQHGELLVSYDTAEKIAVTHDHGSLEELFLYIVHGLLHLNGHLDHDVSHREEMHRIQNRIWAEVLAG